MHTETDLIKRLQTHFLHHEKFSIGPRALRVIYPAEDLEMSLDQLCKKMGWSFEARQTTPYYQLGNDERTRKKTDKITTYIIRRSTDE